MKKIIVAFGLVLTLGGCNAVVYENGRRPVASVYTYPTPVYVHRPHYVHRHHRAYNPYSHHPYFGVDPYYRPRHRY